MLQYRDHSSNDLFRCVCSTSSHVNDVNRWIADVILFLFNSVCGQECRFPAYLLSNPIQLYIDIS